MLHCNMLAGSHDGSAWKSEKGSRTPLIATHVHKNNTCMWEWFHYDSKCFMNFLQWGPKRKLSVDRKNPKWNQDPLAPILHSLDHFATRAEALRSNITTFLWLVQDFLRMKCEHSLPSQTPLLWLPVTLLGFSLWGEVRTPEPFSPSHTSLDSQIELSRLPLGYDSGFL